MAEELSRLDRRLAETHGAYFGFRPEAGPVRTEDLGLSPAAEVDRLLDRDAGYLEAYLLQNPATVSDWRLGPRPIDPATDRPGLELYCRYHTGADGVRLRRHRWVFVRRRAPTRYYPADGPPGAGDVAG